MQEKQDSQSRDPGSLGKVGQCVCTGCVQFKWLVCVEAKCSMYLMMCA